mmetsp:Transcript_13942/g.21074  ORF Transcript_13942/g.21074 Transcript_13942/m.21074 type:complete len:656 (-) Transcript_13942:126-2093(-)
MEETIDILGTIDVDPDLLAPQQLPSDDEEDTEIVYVEPPKWVEGEEVEVYSRSKNKWIPAIVKKIMLEDGVYWVQVFYKKSTQMKDVRADSQDIRHPQGSSEGKHDVKANAPPKPLVKRNTVNQPVTTLKEELLGSMQEMENLEDDVELKNASFVQLLHQVGILAKQVEGGLYVIKRVATVIHRLAALEQGHISASLRVLEQEKHKLQEKSLEDEMSKCVDAWEGTEKYLAELMGKRIALAKSLESNIVVPMMQFYNDSEMKRKAIMKDEKRFAVEMNKAKVGVKRNLQNCQKLISSCKAAKVEAEEKKKNTGTKKKKFGIMSWAMNKIRGSLGELQTQAATAAKNYKLAIDYANKRQKQYYEKELPMICTNLEMLEKSRISALRKYLDMLNVSSFKHYEPVLKLVKSHKSVVTAMNVEKDISEYVRHSLRLYGPYVSNEPFTYQLPCSMQDIKAGRFEGNPNSFFYTTLEYCMELQKGKSLLDVPIILVNLINAVKMLGGYTVEGIFRLSATKDDLIRLRAQFDRGNYEVKETSPHVPAGLLKQWLRELAEPLIPTTSYEEAINIAKAKPTAKDIQRFVKNLPDLNQKVIEHIVKMAGEIAALSSVNKMTFGNLAIVFAPGILRNPSDDPAEMLENSKYESIFTKVLLEASTAN